MKSDNTFAIIFLSALTALAGGAGVAAVCGPEQDPASFVTVEQFSKSIATVNTSINEVKAAVDKLAPPKVDPTVEPDSFVLIEGPTEWTVGSMVHLKAGGKATKFLWDPDPKLLEGNNVHLDSDGKKLSFSSPVADKYVFVLAGWDDKGGVGIVRQTVTIGTPEPPKPVDPPKPPGPVPTPGQISVLIVEETADRGKPELRPFLGVLNSTAIRAYCNTHCTKDAGLPAWRIFDKDQLSGLPAKWKPAVDAPKASLPWLVILDAKGVVAVSQALPPSEADTLKLLTAWGGP